MTEQEIREVQDAIYNQAKGRIKLDLSISPKYEAPRWMEYLVVQSRDNPNRVTAIIFSDHRFILCEMERDIPTDYFSCHPSHVRVATWRPKSTVDLNLHAEFKIKSFIGESRHMICVSQEDSNRIDNLIEKINEKHKKEKGTL